MKEQFEIETKKDTEIQEKLAGLESRVSLLEIIAKKGIETQSEVPLEEKVKVVQINEVPPPNKYDNKGKLVGEKHVGRGPFFCTTPEEQRLFAENNSGMKTESFNVELPADVAERYLNDPKNKKQFIRQGVENDRTDTIAR